MLQFVVVVHNWQCEISSGVSAVDERDEIRAFRPLAQWREIIQSVGLTDSYLYEMEKGDPTYDEMMCFYKGELKDWASSVTTSDGEPTENDQQLVLNRTNTMAFYENSERKVEALFKNLPNIAHETAKVSTYYSLLSKKNTTSRL